MPKILRKTLTPFGNSGPASSFGQFGSKTAGIPQTSQDPAVIQQLAAWTSGWQAAVVTANKAAYLEDMNGWCFVHSYMMAYILQQGIPEWDIGTTYYLNSVVQANAGQWFNSLQDSNVGNAPPVGSSNAFWRWINAPEILDGGVTVNNVPKVSAAGPGKLVDSAVTDDGINVKTSLPLKFPDNTVQTTAAAPISIQSVVTGSRTLNTTYQNTTGKVMHIAVSCGLVGGSASAVTDASLTPTTQVALISGSNAAPPTSQLFFLVLPGNFYRVNTSGSVSLSSWVEWR